MRLIACLAWYNEPSSALRRLVRSLADVCDLLVAVDGAYALFPNATATSPPGQAKAIADEAKQHGLPVDIHFPAEPYAGNEVEKRSLLMQLACEQAELGTDWLLVIDADMRIGYASPDLKPVLAELTVDVADYWLNWPVGLNQTPGQQGPGGPNRALFRALPGLRVHGAHYIYVAERDGATVYLRGRQEFHTVEPAADVTDLLHIEHLTALRPHERLMAAAAFYERRDTEAIEHVPRGPFPR